MCRFRYVLINYGSYNKTKHNMLPSLRGSQYTYISVDGAPIQIREKRAHHVDGPVPYVVGIVRCTRAYVYARFTGVPASQIDPSLTRSSRVLVLVLCTLVASITTPPMLSLISVFCIVIAMIVMMTVMLAVSAFGRMYIYIYIYIKLSSFWRIIICFVLATTRT
jgi:hypothetical protein